MGKQNSTFTAAGDINELSINAFGADVEITTGGAFNAEFAEGSFSVEERKGRINIKRKKKALPSLAKVQLKIEIPESCVPDIRAVLKKSTLDINGGIYGSLSMYGESGKMNVSGASFNVIFVKGSQMHCEYSSATVKSAFICHAKSADILDKESFFSRIDIDIKSGNIGLWQTDFQMSEIKVHDGNIQAMLLGGAEDYRLLLNAKNGTSNRESGGSGAKSMKCSAAHGNVIVDFSNKNKENDNNVNDDVAEDSGGESGS